VGYVPHHAARRLARTRSGARSPSFDQIGLIFLTNPNTPGAYIDSVCLAMMQGAEHELSKLNASLTFVRVREERDWAKAERLARTGGVDGWLLYGAPNDKDVNQLKPTRLPHVILGDHRCTRPVHSINVDHVATGRLGAQHLASLGHRRIGYFGHGAGLVYQAQRLQGFRAARKELGLDQDERLIADPLPASMSDYAQSDQNAEAMLEWLRNTAPMPTALFIPEFIGAAALCRIFKQAQVDVPGQISIIVGDYAASVAKGNNLTRIDLPMAEVGRQGALLLHRIVLGPRAGPREVKIFPTLIEGWSTQAVSSGNKR
jgi:DNA-binding LacI/PurR family transcriptional regulator